VSPPSGFAAWCDFMGYSLVPAEWPAEAHVHYRAWKLARWRAHVRHFRDIGQWDLIRAQSGRERLIALVREGLAHTLEDAPPQVYGRSDRRIALHRDVGGKPPLRTLAVMLGVYARMGHDT
jgi:hypothetical protein